MALTTNVTRFFREPHHFDPRGRGAGAARRGRARRRQVEAVVGGVLDGAGALFDGAGRAPGVPDAPLLDVRILATDIDENVLMSRAAGAYSGDAIEAIPAPFRNRWLEKDPGASRTWRVGGNARALVSFKPLNSRRQLAHARTLRCHLLPQRRDLFRRTAQALVWRPLQPLFGARRELYVGHSERVSDPAFVSDGQTVYRLGMGESA